MLLNMASHIPYKQLIKDDKKESNAAIVNQSVAHQQSLFGF